MQLFLVNAFNFIPSFQISKIYSTPTVHHKPQKKKNQFAY